MKKVKMKIDIYVVELINSNFKNEIPTDERCVHQYIKINRNIKIGIKNMK